MLRLTPLTVGHVGCGREYQLKGDKGGGRREDCVGGMSGQELAQVACVGKGENS